MRRNQGQRKPKFLWDSLEREAANVIAISRKRHIPLYGSVDGGPHQSIPHDYFANDVFGEPVLDTIGPDPLAWEKGAYPDGLPTYRLVRSLRDDVEAYLAKETPKGTDSGGDEQIVNTPPYVEYMMQVYNNLNLGKMKTTKDNIEIEIRNGWSKSLGPISNRMVSSMATLLRDPSAKKGGHFHIG